MVKTVKNRVEALSLGKGGESGSASRNALENQQRKAGGETNAATHHEVSVVLPPRRRDR